MPNTGRITLCPFFVKEHNNNLTCEDANRRFESEEMKNRYMDTFCDSEWKCCEWAIASTEAYERGDFMEHKINEIEKENRKLNIKITKLTAEVAAKDEVIEDLKKELEVSQKRISWLSDKYRESQQAILAAEAKEEQAFLEIAELGNICEARVAYVMDKTGMGMILESDFKNWYEKNEFRLIPSIKDEKVMCYSVEVREAKDDEHGTDGSAGEVKKAGRGKTEEAGSESTKPN